VTTSQGSAPLETCPLPYHGSPVGYDGNRVSLYSSDFAADPHRIYLELRSRYGSLASVDLAPGVPPTLVLGYRTALRILHDPEHVPADPRTWQRGIAADCPVLPTLDSRASRTQYTGALRALAQRCTASVARRVPVGETCCDVLVVVEDRDPHAASHVQDLRLWSAALRKVARCSIAWADSGRPVAM
jgi:hypothetical protein